MKALKAISPYIVMIGLVVLIVMAFSSLMTGPKLAYTQFVSELKVNNVSTVKLEGNKATVKLKEQSKLDPDIKAGEYTVYVHSQENFEALMTDVTMGDQGISVKYTAVDNELPFVVRLIPYILFVLIFLIFLYMMFSQGQGGNNRAVNFGRSRARLYTSSKITFEHVAGAEEEKEEMAELVSFLKEPRRYASLGARIPKGVLMVGPPGTGKTYLAKAVAGEANVPFFSISGSDFVEMYVGVGASRVRDLFEQAKKNAPCIIFIDEIDAIGRSRDSRYGGGGNEEREQTLNQLLSEMDGFDTSKGILILGATNRPEILDKALLRPGRFDRRIIVDKPDLKGRIEILKVHAKDVKMDESVDFDAIALATSGAVGSDLANMINEAAINAVKEKREFVSQKDLFNAVEIVLVGKEKKDRILSEQERKIVSYLEVGHALVSALQKNSEPVQKITIVP